MITLAIVVAALVLIALLRFGVAVEYSENGLTVTARVAFIKITVFPMRKRKKRAEKAERKPREPKKSGTPKKPGGTVDFKKLISDAMALPDKLRRRILIKELTVWFTQGGGDPYAMAMGYGGISAAMGFTQGALEAAFRVKRYSLRTAVDFLAEKSKIYAKASISLAVWEAIYLGIAALGIFLGSRKPKAAIKPAEQDSQISGGEPVLKGQ